MLIIKPYGRSHTNEHAEGRRRSIALREAPNELHDIVNFARTSDELVIAQWISAIDKIAAKPSGDKGATSTQREFRNRLGKAAWAHLARNGLLPGLADAERAQSLAKIWTFKIAPYGSREHKDRKGRDGRPFPQPSAKGRFYARFAGDVDVGHTDAEAIVRNIHGHLYDNELKLGAEGQRRTGRIDARAHSIAINVLQPKSKTAQGWSEADVAQYARAGDVAALIRQAAVMREKGEDGAGTRKVSNSVAGSVLYAHWQRVFASADGTPMTIAEASAIRPGQFALHMAIKDFYVRKLKHHGKPAPRPSRDNQRPSDSPIVTVLPRTMMALLKQMKNGDDNRRLNELVRLGKVIHYHASQGKDDAPSTTIDNWPGDANASRFWNSAGQAEVKRNEAFVRVWRHVLSLAARTLRDWANPHGNSDILGGREIMEAIGPVFESGRYRRKCALLFGSSASLFTGNDEFERAVLNAILSSTAILRHKSFHFAGKGGFTEALEGLAYLPQVGRRAEVIGQALALLESDRRGYAARLKSTLAGAHFAEFFNAAQIHRVYDAVTGAPVGRLPLPRLANLLQRAENAWVQPLQKERLLPEPANRIALEQPGRLCAYTALKLLYEKPFRAWLEVRDVAALNKDIKRAVDRATQAARDLNTKSDEPSRDIIVSRAEKLGMLGPGETIHDFLDRLTAETASEMRVQQGYESDGDKAREQAAFIEEFKCDVVALAFRAYLDTSGFGFLLHGLSQLPDDQRFDMASLPEASPIAKSQDWHALLYLVIHLVPVDEIGRLLHQLRKWSLLSRKDGCDIDVRVGTAMEVMELYLDMHDAKFTGGAALTGTEEFRQLFETEEAFATIFPAQLANDDDRRVPRRGLREIMRFGHLRPLLALFRRHRVSADEAKRWLTHERGGGDGLSAVARWQTERETLHGKWIKDTKTGLGADERRAYVEALAEITRHRHLAAHVTLTNHVRLHRLLMSVMGRLVDFSGLWERDLYFATMALIHEMGKSPGELFNNVGLDRLSEGRIVDALRNLTSGRPAKDLQAALEPHFGTVWAKGDPLTRIRNGLAHFNMLQGGNPDLTQAVNDIRQLLRQDRKLKNAVAGAVIELLAREGLDLSWTMDATMTPHRLGKAVLTPRQAVHLGKTRLFRRGEPEKPFAGKAILENLHGRAFVDMVASLFAGDSSRRRSDVTQLAVDEIDWNRSTWRIIGARPDRKFHGRRPKNHGDNTR